MMTSIIDSDIDEILKTQYISWDRFANKTVLLTGANGMLPSYMGLTLLKLNKTKQINVRVVALVRNLEKAKKVYSNYVDDDHLRFIVQDVSTPITLDGKCDFIIHAASQASPKYYGVDPVGTLNANILGLHYLLELARKKNTESFLFFSSGGVYGQVKTSEMPMSESVSGYLDCRSIRNCYFESKRMGENMCASYAYQYGVNAKSVRVFHTYGPTMNINDGRAFSDFCKSIKEGKNIVLHSDGSARRTFCYVTDAVKAYFLVLLNGEKGTSYNVGNSNQELSVQELANMLVELYPNKHLKVAMEILEKSITYSSMKSPVVRTVPDTSLIEKMGWKPSVSAKEGFRRTIDSLME